MIEKPRFNGIRLEMELRAESPMIHFQPNTPGATVRATEVKPKLDKFLLKKLTMQTGLSIEQLKKNPDYQGMFLKADDNALKYKMQIVSEEANSYSAGGRNDYGIFYGNMGVAEKKKAVFSDSKLIIQCFHGKLRNLLSEYLNEFFLVTNFGTMQGKGFGSFAPSALTRKGQLNEAEINEITEYLKAMADAPVCYCMKFATKTPRDLHGDGRNAYSNLMFKEIKDFYGIMKSGMNFKGYAKSFVFKYMLNKKFGNEKALLKYKGLAPKVATTDIGRAKAANMKEPVNPRYVRAMLGVGSTLTYREKGKADVTINITSQEFERVSSPIFFKIVGNVVFIVAKKIPKELYNKPFTFERGREKQTIMTPKAEEFDLQEMLKQYVVYYNKELRENDITMIKNYKKVVKLS